ncbi:hypothetical protein [Ensifer adhaerens]
MADSKITPMPEKVRARARACGIEVAIEREDAIVVGAQYLADAARRLDTIAANNDDLAEPERP